MVKIVFTLELWRAEWMTIVLLKAKKFREILSDHVGQNSKAENRALFL